MNSSHDLPSWFEVVGKFLAGVGSLIGAGLLIRKWADRRRLQRVRKFGTMRRELRAVRHRVDAVEQTIEHAEKKCTWQTDQCNGAFKRIEASVDKAFSEISGARREILEAVLKLQRDGGGGQD